MTSWSHASIGPHVSLGVNFWWTKQHYSLPGTTSFWWRGISQSRASPRVEQTGRCPRTSVRTECPFRERHVDRPAHTNAVHAHCRLVAGWIVCGRDFHVPTPPKGRRRDNLSYLNQCKWKPWCTHLYPVRIVWITIHHYLYIILLC